MVEGYDIPIGILKPNISFLFTFILWEFNFARLTRDILPLGNKWDKRFLLSRNKGFFKRWKTLTQRNEARESLLFERLLRIGLVILRGRTFVLILSGMPVPRLRELVMLLCMFWSASRISGWSRSYCFWRLIIPTACRCQDNRLHREYFSRTSIGWYTKWRSQYRTEGLVAWSASILSSIRWRDNLDSFLSLVWWATLFLLFQRSKMNEYIIFVSCRPQIRAVISSSDTFLLARWFATPSREKGEL